MGTLQFPANLIEAADLWVWLARFVCIIQSGNKQWVSVGLCVATEEKFFIYLMQPVDK